MMELESQFLTKKRSSTKLQDITSTFRPLIKIFSKKIEKVQPQFKLKGYEKDEIMKRILKACLDKSNESLYTIFSNEITSIDLEMLDEKDIEEFMNPVICESSLINVKRRVYDIDSNKKLLRKNIWNYIESLIFELSFIKNIKSVDNYIKHNTKKDFEKKLMDTKIKELYDKHYNIKVEYIIERMDMNKYQNIKKEKNKYYHLSKSEKEIFLNDLLNRTFKDFFIEYRNSDKFWEDAKEDCQDDKKKLVNYIQMAKKFRR